MDKKFFFDFMNQPSGSRKLNCPVQCERLTETEKQLLQELINTRQNLCSTS